jgi:hypothetical protein
MKFTKAEKLARRLNAIPGIAAEVIRILPRDIDPPKENDSGWDVKVFDLTETESYESRVRALEAEGMTRSDAQAVADAESMQRAG